MELMRSKNSEYRVSVLTGHVSNEFAKLCLALWPLLSENFSGGAGHAFFDWKPDEQVKATFARFGVYHADGMKRFFESTLY